MQFHDTTLSGAKLITLTKHGDDRGFVARTFCRDLFANEGLVTDFPQANHSSSALKGTLRGMHYQRSPHGEVKVVRVVRGAIFDVIIDLRPDSPSYLQHQGFELTDQNHQMLYVPAGFAHGFQTLEDQTVTLRDRDTLKQERVHTDQLSKMITDKVDMANIL